MVTHDSFHSALKMWSSLDGLLQPLVTWLNCKISLEYVFFDTLNAKFETFCTALRCFFGRYFPFLSAQHVLLFEHQTEVTDYL